MENYERISSLDSKTRDLVDAGYKIPALVDALCYLVNRSIADYSTSIIIEFDFERFILIVKDNGAGLSQSDIANIEKNEGFGLF
ncbi:hypothetical protein AYI70_g6143 [Smittium culicis]|uniref:Uncharacterized protein n=1 Tax=Smittium culicis TaxID=133412 RepID=A0A1R1XRA6_9FUNG|nr:hypothetical protein AYI70_g6143 [Smittium culicis]